MSRKYSAKEKEHARRILELLDREYTTKMQCYLEHDNAWQLLFSTILSAQCTDARVNIVTRELYRKYPDLEAFAKADLREMEEDVRPTGFYHHKAQNLIQCAKALLERHGGQVPDSLEALTALPGVGRKTANVIRGNVFGQPSIVVDTHVRRISQKLGFTTENDPVKIEFELMELLPKDRWILYNIHIIRLGRTVCFARNPQCESCFLRSECPAGKQGMSRHEKKKEGNL